MLYLTYALNFLLMIALPLLLGAFLARRLGVTWSLFGIGAVTFIASQGVHLPLNAGLTALFANHLLPSPPLAWKLPFNSIVLGLTAGLCEEIARYVVYRRWITSARTWREALMFGAGHGGIEAIIFGALAGLGYVNIVVLKNTDLSSYQLSPEQQALAAQQIAAYWSAPWYATLLGALERLFSLTFHLAMAVVMLQAINRKNLWWLALAILLHATTDAVAVFAVSTWGLYWTEAIIGVFALISLGLIFGLKPAHEAIVPEPVTLLPSTAPSPAAEPEDELRDKLDESRFSS